VGIADREWYAGMLKTRVLRSRFVHAHTPGCDGWHPWPCCSRASPNRNCRSYRRFGYDQACGAGKLQPAPPPAADAVAFPEDGFTLVNRRPGTDWDSPLTLRMPTGTAYRHWIVSVRDWATGKWLATAYLSEGCDHHGPVANPILSYRDPPAKCGRAPSLAVPRKLYRGLLGAVCSPCLGKQLP
jgi:hypothetical protein